MSTFRRYNPQLERSLIEAARSERPEALPALLGGLAVSARRTAGYLLSDRVLPALGDETYWRVFGAVVPADTKAYLMTFLKAFVTGYRDGRFVLSLAPLQALSLTATPIDRRKLCETLLPVLRSSTEVKSLLEALSCYTLDCAADWLIAAQTVPCYHQLFLLMRQEECRPALLRRYALELIKVARPLSFRMAAIAEQYFGLPDLPATFASRLEPFELSRLELGYEPFAELLRR